MKKMPEFINEILIKKYEIQIVNLNFNKKIQEFGLIEGFNRIAYEKSNSYELYYYQTALEAKKIVFDLIFNMTNNFYLIWANQLTYEIKVNASFIHSHFDSILEEDWDFWLIYEDKFIIEIYHEGEIVFIPNQYY